MFNVVSTEKDQTGSSSMAVASEKRQLTWSTSTSWRSVKTKSTTQKSNVLPIPARARRGSLMNSIFNRSSGCTCNINATNRRKMDKKWTSCPENGCVMTTEELLQISFGSSRRTFRSHKPDILPAG